jgi:prepilin-type N-terminal cleavage/methylation domain-containing protein
LQQAQKSKNGGQEVKMKEQMSSKLDAKGFTLIELAIVLVIIGIIIGAVLKGQDLIEGARHKKLVTEVRLWDVLTWAFLDRKGYLPGDGDKDGLIDGGTTTVKADLQTLSGAPTANSITLGSFRFYLWLGTDGTSPKNKNILTITNHDITPAAFSSDELAYMESIDVAIDGTSDGIKGRVRASGDATVYSGTWVGTVSGGPASGTWTATTKGLVYYFDRSP